MKTPLKSHYHCVYKINYNLVLVTKSRKKCLTIDMADRLKTITEELCQKWEIGLIGFDSEADHVHLLLDVHPNIMPSKFVNNLKTVTSRLIRKEFATELAGFYREPVLWDRGYCLLTPSDDTMNTIRQYIEK